MPRGRSRSQNVCVVEGMPVRALGPGCSRQAAEAEQCEDAERFFMAFEASPAQGRCFPVKLLHCRDNENGAALACCAPTTTIGKNEKRRCLQQRLSEQAEELASVP